eukprot:Sspe_Gene.98448::Locus_71863_Transcript_1_1_Confidence_1.000_Length_607::g.98448::m.98448
MARHLVEDVHPMFRGGFERVRQMGAGDQTVAVEHFNRINRSLHGHHGSEDTLWFPLLRRRHPSYAEEVDILESDHQRLVDLESRILAGDYQALSDFCSSLDDHLNREEMITVPFLLEGSGGW